MAIELLRIDDRFIHGQVVVGWCPYLNPDRLILCDDEISRSDWEIEIYREAATDYKTSVCSVEETVRLLENNEVACEKVLLIVESPAVTVKLLNLGVAITKVNVGGMHHQPGKRQVAPFIYINDEDLENFKILAHNHILIQGMDVPNCKPIDLIKLLHLN